MTNEEMLSVARRLIQHDLAHMMIDGIDHDNVTDEELDALYVAQQNLLVFYHLLKKRNEESS